MGTLLRVVEPVVKDYCVTICTASLPGATPLQLQGSPRYSSALSVELLPRPPNVPLLRALWSLLDGIWGLLKGSWGVLVQPKHSTTQLDFTASPPGQEQRWRVDIDPGLDPEHEMALLRNRY